MKLQLPFCATSRTGKNYLNLVTSLIKELLESAQTCFSIFSKRCCARSKTMKFKIKIDLFMLFFVNENFSAPSLGGLPADAYIKNINWQIDYACFRARSKVINHCFLVRFNSPTRQRGR
jgi:hypothetical protein